MAIHRLALALSPQQYSLMLKGTMSSIPLFYGRKFHGRLQFQSASGKAGKSIMLPLLLSDQFLFIHCPLSQEWDNKRSRRKNVPMTK
jgi:hypothetical protein